MASQVEICNLALTHIGVKSISSMTEPSEPARKLNLVYPTARDAALRAHDWSFASQEVALAEVANESVLAWDYLYKYPASCVAVRELYNPNMIGGGPEPLTRFDAELGFARDRSTTRVPIKFQELLSPQSNQKAIGTNLPSAYARFTFQVTDPSLYDASFVTAFSYLLASMLAQHLAGNPDLGKGLYAIASQLISEAGRQNKSEGVDEPSKTSPYVNGR